MFSGCLRFNRTARGSPVISCPERVTLPACTGSSPSTARIKAGRSTLGYIAMGVDVTDHKRVDQWARLQSGVLESLRDF